MPTGVYVRRPRPPVDPLPRFWTFVEKTATCWNWTGNRDKGYGKFWWSGRSITASRFAYERFIGAIPAGMGVLHRCDNPACVRPDHLFVGTTADNTRDAIEKGRFDRFHLKHARKAQGSENNRTKLTEAQVREIRAQYRKGRAPYAEATSLRGLARAYGVTKYTIFSVLHGLTWRHLSDSVIV